MSSCNDGLPEDDEGVSDGVLVSVFEEKEPGMLLRRLVPVLSLSLGLGMLKMSLWVDETISEGDGIDSGVERLFNPARLVLEGTAVLAGTMVSEVHVSSTYGDCASVVFCCDTTMFARNVEGETRVVLFSIMAAVLLSCRCAFC